MKNTFKLPEAGGAKPLTKVQEYKNHLSIMKSQYRQDIFEYRWKTIEERLKSINALLGREISIVSKLHKWSDEREYMFNVFVDGEYDVLASFEVLEDRDYFLQCLEERYEYDCEKYLVQYYGLEWSREENQYVEKA